jgi:hypothetical protein
VAIMGVGSDGNVVAGNYIGTDRLGAVALANGDQGVAIIQGAASNRIGTNGDGSGDGAGDAAEGNLI